MRVKTADFGDCEYFPKEQVTLEDEKVTSGAPSGVIGGTYTIAWGATTGGTVGASTSKMKLRAKEPVALVAVTV
ncbi:unannotated protein [freshwater metagenome]|uniref:Unannotated protein n=1 Tax=freshwater metagenome TaxID=449393 RepID=A0A6J6NN11_9ZZZZ